MNSPDSDSGGGGTSVGLQSPPQEKLLDRIVKSYCPNKSTIHYERFFPNDALCRLVTEDTIITEDEFVAWILKEAPKLFLICVRLKLKPRRVYESLTQFKKLKFTDQNLPIQDLESEDCQFREYFIPYCRTSSFFSDFFDEQWKFLCPFFKDTPGDYSLHERHILPFIEKDSQGKAGAFGQVHKVTIHEAHRHPTIGQDLVREALSELRGLADGLRRLHIYEPDQFSQTEDQSALNPSEANIDGINNAKIPNIHVEEVGGQTVIGRDESGNQSIRHGDLKPENILRFLDSHTKDNSGRCSIGNLKIADLGLAKRHVVATEYRAQKTSTMYGTALYEAPEAARSLEKKARSRLYDVWSMGCIIFEFVLWMLHGNEMVTELHDRLKKGSNQYFELSTGMAGTARVHRTVTQWMQYLQENDPDCRENTVIGDLLRLVKTKLLVVDLPPGGHSGGNGQLVPTRPFQPPPPGEDKTNYRCTAEGLLRELDEISHKMNDDSGYTLSGKEITRTAKADYTLPPLEDWEYPVDNDFAGKAVNQLETTALRPLLPHSPLCWRCSNLNFWKGGFAIEDKIEDLYGRSQACLFCQMLWNAHRKFGLSKTQKVRFERHESTLKLSGTESTLPTFCILRSPKLHTPLPIQIGFPQLPQPGTNIFFSLLRLWLQDCDDGHKGCGTPKLASLPTRLIDVGTTDSPRLRLLETNDLKLDGQRYIALSHPWGDQKKHPPFSTLKRDPSGQGRELEEFKKAIPSDQLPATFRDAAITTRALNIRYLWIDSLCIIQGEDGDFSEESKRMEDVFSCAYCVLAASRATGQHDGFLQPINQREYITFPGTAGNPFYVCENIDDFSGDVLEGSLNTRGWVLQERALARRTIFFTERQAYFECGKGVRCQSLTNMHNNMSDFLGDPNFPNKAVSVQRGLRIRYFQDLYKQYSRLNFTHIEDRPFAIEGLENRLRTAYETGGAYGIFDDGLGKGLFHRSLLWQRGEDEPAPGLLRIVFPLGRRVAVPTWSWMAYRGGIDYVDPPFDQTVWEKEDIHPPRIKSNTSSLHGNARMELLATVRWFNTPDHQDGELKLVYDTGENKPSGMRLQCVVVAKSKEGQTFQEKKCYVLLVSPLDTPVDGGYHIYERVGAGAMLGRFISFNEPSQQVKIR
ncbi:HET-domain-containing protein [Xylaria digitata]|nr:HET-domain-containing protein [Xylaria digitata]